VKAGYPPQPLTAVIPELPLSSLGIRPGEQLIVTQKPSSAPPAVPTGFPPSVEPRANIVDPTASLTPPSASPYGGPSAFTPPSSADANIGARNGPDYVETEGGYLVHSVRGLYTSVSSYMSSIFVVDRAG